MTGYDIHDILLHYSRRGVSHARRGNRTVLVMFSCLVSCAVYTLVSSVYSIYNTYTIEDAIASAVVMSKTSIKRT